jgi:hypothetical protein
VALHVDGVSFPVDNPMVIEGNDVSYAPFFFDTLGPHGTASLFATYTYTPNPANGVPEPSTWAMMIVGFAGLGYAAYRRAHPSLDGSKRMFCGLASDAHGPGRAFQPFLVQ